MIKVNGNESLEYFFRVSAENKCGIGPTVESKKPTLFVDPFVKPMPVRYVKVSARGFDYIKISYSKPEWGSGEPVTHYKLLGKMSDSSEWKQLVSREAFKAKNVKVLDESGSDDSEPSDSHQAGYSSDNDSYYFYQYGSIRQAPEVIGFLHYLKKSKLPLSEFQILKSC